METEQQKNKDKQTNLETCFNMSKVLSQTLIFLKNFFRTQLYIMKITKSYCNYKMIIHGMLLHS